MQWPKAGHVHMHAYIQKYIVVHTYANAYQCTCTYIHAYTIAKQWESMYWNTY